MRDRSVCMVPQSCEKKLGRLSAEWIVKVPPYSVIVGNGDNFHAAPARSDGDIEGLSAVDTVRYHVLFVKKRYSLPNAVHFVPDFKTRFLMPSSAGTENGPKSVLERAYSDFVPAQEDGTEDHAAPRQSSNQD